MDTKNLIEQYRQAADKWEKRHPVTDTFDLRVQDVLRDAATALYTLQGENEKLRTEKVKVIGNDELMDELQAVQAENEKLRAEADGMRSNWYKAVEEVKNLRTELDEKEKYYDQMIDALSATDNTELERMKRERDAAVKDLETLCRDDVGPCEMAICELCAYNSGVQCSNPDGQSCDGYDVFNWKWRGPQKED